jgi:parallel beta-helix repeat protein
MGRKSIKNIFMLLLIIFGVTVTQANATVITVDNNGGGNYTAIQNAVNNAQNGDIILVSHGTYRENIKVDKELTIISHSALSGNQTDRTYIIGTVPGKGVIYINSSNVTIEGFYIAGRASGTDFHRVGIYLDQVQNCYLINNTVLLNDLGIALNDSHGNYLRDNLISLGSYGIALNHSENNIILNNLVITDTRGMLLNNSVNNTLINNTEESSSIKIYQRNESTDLANLLNKNLTENASENISSNSNVIRTLLNEKYLTSIHNTQEKTDFVRATELGQINISLQKGPVFFRIGAEWCPYCQALKPILKELANEYRGKATVMIIDITQSPELMSYFGVGHIPDCSVVVGIENGEYVYMQENGDITKDRSKARIVGLNDREVYEKLLDLALLYEEKEKSR